MPQPGAATSFRSSDPPAWVLLDTLPHIGSHRNATAVSAITSAGATIEVSVALVYPPALSLCFVDCRPGPCPTAASEISGEPRVTGAGAGLVLLLRVTFAERGDQGMFTDDIFVYRAGPGKPSLHRLPRPYPVRLFSEYVGVLAYGDGVSGEHYLVVVPQPRFEAGVWCKEYNLQVFSLATASWGTKVVRAADDMGQVCWLCTSPPR
ncbi:hypothetical protein ACP70R_000035 [Stipagrostis hirtigluma subsp. patula]